MFENTCPVSPIKMNHILASYKNTKERAKHFVMWSGGCDSTLLLYELLDAYGSDNVVAISYVYPWLPKNKIESERNHRDLFKSKMKLKGSKFNGFAHKEFIFTETNYESNNKIYCNGQGLPQSVAWMLSVPLYTRNGDYVYDGGIKNDDLTLVIENYHKLFDSVSALLSRDLVLREPYLYFNKRDVVERLIEYGIYDSTWFCEIPSDYNIPCGECVPCKTHQCALVELSGGLNNSSEYVKEIAKKELGKISEFRNSKNTEKDKLEIKED